jgi:GH24 family phage-related lysozyme (muramidase)
MLDTPSYLPKLKEFEGNYSYMYLDTTGNVTVGVGEMLPNAAAAQKFAFVRRADATAKPPVLPGAATADEIKADFDNVKKQTAGKLATYYRQFTKLDLPQSVIDATVTAEVFQFTVSLTASFPDFNSYPTEACAALFDMAYNLGISGLTSKFPTFCKVVKDKDWATTAKQCQRGGIGDARNDWTKAQFEKAAAGAAAAPKAASPAP